MIPKVLEKHVNEYDAMRQYATALDLLIVGFVVAFIVGAILFLS